MDGRARLLALGGLTLALAACLDTNDADQGSADGGRAFVSFQPAVACDAKPEQLYGDPGRLPNGRGAIIRCVDDGLISKEEVTRRLAALQADSRKGADGTPNPGGVRNTYQGAAPKSGANRYRVLYRTERGNGEPGSSVALIYVPEKPSTQKVPLLLLARGSRGQAAACAVSTTTDGPVDQSDAEDGRVTQGDFEAMLWPLVANGFIVIVTDSAGYANYGAPGNPPPAYAELADVGKSFLDSAHALKKFLPEATTYDSLMVGHSQGGHTVLGSLQVANEYPAPGRILGAVVYAPLWFAQRAWGAVLNPIAATDLGGVVLNKSSGLPVSIWYHYTHAELLDGPGEGVKLFKPEVQAVIKDFVETTCWSNLYEKLGEDGRTVAADFYDPALVDAVGDGALARSCAGVSDEPLCEKWLARYRADPPTLTGKAATIPILVAYGLKDQAIDSKRFQCAVDKLRESSNELAFCIDPDANHVGVILNQSSYVTDWLNKQGFDTPMTTKCPASAPPRDLECDPLLPND